MTQEALNRTGLCLDRKRSMVGMAGGQKVRTKGPPLRSKREGRAWSHSRVLHGRCDRGLAAET